MVYRSNIIDNVRSMLGSSSRKAIRAIKFFIKKIRLVKSSPKLQYVTYNCN